MAERPVADPEDISELAVALSAESGVALVYKPRVGELWERDFDTPLSDAGATQITTSEQMTARNLDDSALPIPTYTLPPV